MHLINGGTNIMADFTVVAPSYYTMLLTLTLSLALFAAVRAAVFVFTFVSKSIGDKASDLELVQPRSPFSLRLKWDVLPISFSLSTNKQTLGEGALSHPENTPVHWQVKSGKLGPAFVTPLPAIYQSDVPVSMAKMIMSRHNYRKPTPPRKVSTPAPRRTMSMV
jgi:hypothetical protein